MPQQRTTALPFTGEKHQKTSFAKRVLSSFRSISQLLNAILEKRAISSRHSLHSSIAPTLKVNNQHQKLNNC
ncbi:hypothetical protein, partial [Photobacterium sanctipauli]|uniref:hypothetical protein n=1 Tax=Photobacterium sanctipauli TaxID=1342794 RepID=UPI001C1DDDA4